MSEEPYGMVVARDVMVPMRDGVRLATDVGEIRHRIRCSAGRRFPCRWQRPHAARVAHHVHQVRRTQHAAAA